MRPGDRVIATTDISGFTWKVPKGTKGVVVEVSAWNGRPKVAFTLPGGVITNDHVRTVDVSKDDVAKI